MDIENDSVLVIQVVDEYGLNQLPSLVYYRQQAPILYEGISNEQKNLKKGLSTFL